MTGYQWCVVPSFAILQRFREDVTVPAGARLVALRLDVPEEFLPRLNRTILRLVQNITSTPKLI